MQIYETVLGGSFIKHTKKYEAIRFIQKYIHSMITTLDKVVRHSGNYHLFEPQKIEIGKRVGRPRLLTDYGSIDTQRHISDPKSVKQE
jgi:hypothetical protein